MKNSILILALVFVTACGPCKKHKSGHGGCGNKESKAVILRYKTGDEVYSRLDSTKYIILRQSYSSNDYYWSTTIKNGERIETEISDVELY